MEDLVQMKAFLKDIRNGIYEELAQGTNPMLIPSTMETFSVFLKKKIENMHQLLNSFLRVAV